MSRHPAPAGAAPGRTARAAGLVGCRVCGLASPRDLATCPRCGAHLASRAPRSLQRVWALWLVGLMCYVPANLLPMLITDSVGQHYASTIVGGAVEIAAHDLPVALIILLASVAIPIAKFIAIAFLALSIRRRGRVPPAARVHLYEFVEFIGRWSMIDVFVVAILTALVHMGFFASIAPGPAAAFFAFSVIFTMLSAQAMDPRLIWDSAEPDAKHG
ncbi:paraquat-inducible protein A [Amaricoccus solimangrovi]|uniref:paraquat-inducible protein A n=1 Tax=Amaricoccus solimangrovi TaxID=2589815 RepID=UPI001F242571|nr:paraquat-inducible protein A [Amaricoccus solimangrovi]